MNQTKKISKPTTQRFPIYLKVLRNLKDKGVTKVVSSTLAEYSGILATTIRRDFSLIGKFGKQGVGYDIDDLISTFSLELGIYNKEEEIILIGVGNLGRALLNYNNWVNVVGKIVCAFDINPQHISDISIPVYHINDLVKYKPNSCKIAIVCITHDVQNTINLLYRSGITGIVDLTTEHFEIPIGLNVKSIDFVSKIQELVFEANRGKDGV